MADPLPRPSSSNPTLRALVLREEGELSSGGEDESILGRPPHPEPSTLSSAAHPDKITKIGPVATPFRPNLNPLPLPLPIPNPTFPRVTPHAIPHTYRKGYNKRMPYNKLPACRNLSWQKKRPLDDHNLVISFSDDETESDTAPPHTHVPVRPQLTRSGPASTMLKNSSLAPNGSALRPNAASQATPSSSQGNGALGASSQKVLETLRHEIALREKSLKLQKVGSTEETDGRPAKLTKLDPQSNGNHNTTEDRLHFGASPLGHAKGGSTLFQSQLSSGENKRPDNDGRENNDRLLFGGAFRAMDLVMQSDLSAWSNQNTENTDNQARLHLLLEQEDAQNRELEQAQELRRRLEREEREAFKAYRRAQRALFEANEKCILLQKKSDVLSNQINFLLENSSTSNTPWPLCWHDPRESPSEQQADGTRNDNKEEGQLTDSVNTKDQLEEDEHSDIDKRDLPSGNSSPQDYEALEASLRSKLVARYRSKGPTNSTKLNEEDAVDHSSHEAQEKHSLSPNEAQLSPSETTPLSHSISILPVVLKNLPSKGYTTSNEERMIDQENLLARNVIDQPSDQNQENMSFSPNTTQGSPRGSTHIIHSVHNSPSVGGINLQSNNFAESAQDKLANQENLALGEPEESIFPSPNLSSKLPHPMNISTTNSTSVSCTESNRTPLKFITKPAVKGTEENITCTSMEITSVLVVSPFVLPSLTVRNVCVHFKPKASFSNDVLDARFEGTHIVNKLERVRENTGFWGPQVDPFWPFCIFELRGRCNDEECHWQHVKDFEWRNFRPVNSLLAPSGVYHHVLHVPTHQIGSCLIKDGPYMACSIQAQGLWQHWQRGFCALFPVPVSVKRLLSTDAPCLLFPEASVAHQYNEINYLLSEGDLAEAEKCLELALNSSLPKQKVLSMLSRALEREPKSELIWMVYLHIYYMKKKDFGKDDMFLEAVHNNKYSYDLWRMYINSRLKLEDQLSAFSDALTTMCRPRPTSEIERKDRSSIILDLYLHMVNVLCMAGSAEMAISRIFNFSSDELLTAILSSLIVPDKCIFWVTSIYVSTYRKLPEGILEQFLLDKNLYFVIDWPSVNLRTSDEIRVLGLFEHAFTDIGFTEMDPNSPKTDGKYLKELHFLAISHVKCMAAVYGLTGATDLLVKYKEVFPNCVELSLMLARVGDHGTCTYNSNLGVVSSGFETVISDCRNRSHGFQCIWNQYVEHLLASRRFDLARDLLCRWHEESNLEALINDKSESNGATPQKEQLFGLLNLCLYQLMQDDLQAAHLAVDKALKLADQEFYKHCLREHVIVQLLKESLVNQRDISSQVVLDLIRHYRRDGRNQPVRKVLSRKFYQDIKEIRTRQLVDEWLGPVSDDYSLINSILELCYGELLVPENFGINELVNLVESVTQVSPANYRFAFSVCRFVMKKMEFDDIGMMSVRFWTGSLLVNSIFQSVPVAPEPVWVEGAEVLINLKLFEISNRFLEHSVSIYPFSLVLWQLYLSLSKRRNENGDRIVEAAERRGIVLRA